MKYFLSELLVRNATLYYFGWICFIGFAASLIMMATTDTEVNNISAWVKPAKFYISSGILAWTMTWYLGYLPKTPITNGYVWVTIAVFAFELIYISISAYKGNLSHFNISTPGKATMFSLMGIAISIFTLYTAVIGFMFFGKLAVELPDYYLWAIRISIFIFVIFAFEGGMMGARLQHSVGGPDTSAGLPFLNWNMTYGDLRVAHFVGMHALQVIPLLAFYVVHNTKGVIVLGGLYLLLSIAVLIQALNGVPLVRG